MKRNKPIKFLFLAVGLFCIISAFKSADWGFFAHQRINRLAVFTLPEQMYPLFKKYIDFLTEHAVDPDKRRYAFKLEAPRHYLDLDQYKNKCLPITLTEAFSAYGKLRYLSGNDTIDIWVADSSWCDQKSMASLVVNDKTFYLPKSQVRKMYGFHVLPAYYNEYYKIPVDSLQPIWDAIQYKPSAVWFEDHFSAHGMVPYIVTQQYEKLVTAFILRDRDAIINIAADLGHYVADAHVPLHACSNYNGQKSEQHGIHAFWESRIPELFADENYNYLVGKAFYIPDVSAYIWRVIKESGRLADSVLIIEKKLQNSYPTDKQMCFEERLNKPVWTQCTDYAAAYQANLDGMVETRMQQSIISVGSIWYTAWVQAGKPDLEFSNEITLKWMVDSAVIKGEQIREAGGSGSGRDHE